MNEIKFWAIGQRYFINFFGRVVLPVDRIALIVFHDGEASVFDVETITDPNSHGHVFEGEQYDKLLAFCNDEENR